MNKIDGQSLTKRIDNCIDVLVDLKHGTKVDSLFSVQADGVACLEQYCQLLRRFVEIAFEDFPSHDNAAPKARKLVRAIQHCENELGRRREQTNKAKNFGKITGSLRRANTRLRRKLNQSEFHPKYPIAIDSAKHELAHLLVSRNSLQGPTAA